jgi:hypothetical protein
MTHLALDLSKASAGWALWDPSLAVPACGTWELGSTITSPGRVFMRLHQRLNDIHTVTPLQSVSYETPLYLDVWQPAAHKEAHLLLVGLAAHVESYCDARGIRICRSVSMATWRRHFLGKMKRGTKSPDLKAMAVTRCLQLGIKPSRHDAAEACGILDYALHIEGIAAPWRAAGPQVQAA